MTTSGLQVLENNAELVADTVGRVNQKSWQLHQCAGSTTTPTSYSYQMHPDVGSLPLDHGRKVKRKTLIARIFPCCCVCAGPSSSAAEAQGNDGVQYPVTPFVLGLVQTASADSSSSAPTQPNTPISPQNSQNSAIIAKYVTKKHSSGHRPPWDHSHQQQQGVLVATRRTLSNAVSEAATEWTDANSCFSNDLDDNDQEQLEGLDGTSCELQHRGSDQLSICRSPSFKAAWIPDPPLHFADRPLQFVPVPAVTGFAAYWANNPERTTPFPQPIDLMIKANWIVKKVHKSIPGLWIRESEKKLTVVGNPSFVPPGHRAYCEVYDKSNETEPTWSPRRDMQLGHNSGQIYFTADGIMILRVRAWSWPGNKMQYITEDYARLEEDGQVIVNKMWCLDVDTGNSASQYMVGSRHEHPAKHWV